MLYRSFTVFMVAAGVSAGAFAQSPQPYADMQTRPIKALSEQQTSDLKSGRGMGLALAAELNGYPGPSHLLELADRLELTAPQRKSVQQLFDSMKAEAIPLGERLLTKEADLDRQFATHAITPASLKIATAEIGEVQGRLRDTHLKYHLATVALLTSQQLRHYNLLRGYSNGAEHHGMHRSN